MLEALEPPGKGFLEYFTVKIMGITRKGKTRFCMYLTNEEEHLVRYAVKVTGLDKTNAIRLMMRQGCIQQIYIHQQTGIPKITAELQKIIDNL